MRPLEASVSVLSIKDSSYSDAASQRVCVGGGGGNDFLVNAYHGL